MSNPHPFTVTLLGTASAMPVKDRNQSAQALSVHGRLFLVDCGEGVQGRMVQFGLPMMKLDSVFVSHIHGDHMFGLWGLLSTLGMKGRLTPLNLFGPVNLGPLLKFFLSYYGDGLAYEVRFVPLKMKAPETILETKSLRVEAFPLNHGIETFGFRFSEKEPPFNVHKEAIGRYGLSLTEIGTLKRGEDVIRDDGTRIPAAEAAYKPFVPRSYAYCSDTAPFPEEAEWLRGTQVIYHETTYLQEFADQAALRRHSTTLEAAKVALVAGARKLLIGHYSSRRTDAAAYEAECRTLFPESFATSDGDSYEI